MPRGAVIALTVVTLIWLCGCGMVMRMTSQQMAREAPVVAYQTFSVSRTADYAAPDPGRFAAVRVVGVQ